MKVTQKLVTFIGLLLLHGGCYANPEQGSKVTSHKEKLLASKAIIKVTTKKCKYLFEKYL